MTFCVTPQTVGAIDSKFLIFPLHHNQLYCYVFHLITKRTISCGCLYSQSRIHNNICHKYSGPSSPSSESCHSFVRNHKTTRMSTYNGKLNHITFGVTCHMYILFWNMLDRHFSHLTLQSSGSSRIIYSHNN